MAYQYTVQTNKGAYDVTVQKHHDHVSKADFERSLLQALGTLGTGILLHHYSLKVR